MSLEMSIILSIDDFNIMRKWAARVNNPTTKEFNVLKKIEFIIEYLLDEEKDEDE